MAGAAWRGAVAAQPDFGYRNVARWDETLDSDRARCMEEQMAPDMTQAQMTPPEAAPAFLHSAGWGDARILPLAGDASFRRYFREIGSASCRERGCRYV